MTSIKKWVAGVATGLVVLSLAGCGGGTDRSIRTGDNAAVADDNFIAQVRALIALEANSPDVLPYDEITVTMPELSEPVEI